MHILKHRRSAARPRALMKLYKTAALAVPSSASFVYGVDDSIEEMKKQIQELDIADNHRNIMRRFLITSASLLLFAFSSESATLSVGGDANIFGSGHLSPPAPAGGNGGAMPAGISIPAGDDLILRFSSVTGLVTMTKSFGLNGPDGNLGFLPSNLSSFGGLSGIQHDGNGFLAGVFLGPDEPVDPAPPALDFRTSGLGRSFRTLSPQICQLFFVGDGRTGDGLGDVQQFVVPAGSTRFYLGFADGPIIRECLAITRTMRACWPPHLKSSQKEKHGESTL
jgi:hypothetical protein